MSDQLESVIYGPHLGEQLKSRRVPRGTVVPSSGAGASFGAAPLSAPTTAPSTVWDDFDWTWYRFRRWWSGPSEGRLLVLWAVLLPVLLFLVGTVLWFAVPILFHATVTVVGFIVWLIVTVVKIVLVVAAYVFVVGLIVLIAAVCR